MFSWKLLALWSQFRHQNDRNTILYNPPFDGSICRARFYNFISLFIKKGCCFGSFCVWISGGFGTNGCLRSKKVPIKFEELFKKIDISLQKIIFLLLLQLEIQLRLKSAEFSKPATHRIRKKNEKTGEFKLIISFILENKYVRITHSFKTRWL